MPARIALFLVNDTNEYQRFVKADAELAARRSGLQLEVQAANSDAALQVRQLNECIRRPADGRPRAIIVFPVRDSAVSRPGQEAVQAGIGWVLLNRRADNVEPLRRDFPGVPIGVVGPDQIDAGRLQARQARALVPAGGFLLYVMGPALSSAAQDRLAGLQDGLRDSGIELGQVYGNWQTDVAEQAVGDWLGIVLSARLRLDVVVCQNDAMAIGARNVLDRLAAERGRPELLKVPVTGMDGRDDVGKRLVDSGRLAATIVQPSSGGPAVEWVARALKGERVPPAVVLPLTPYPDLARLAPRGSAAR